MIELASKQSAHQDEEALSVYRTRPPICEAQKGNKV